METIKGKNVKITDAFWSGKMKTVHDKVIPYQWEALNDRLPDTEPSYAIAIKVRQKQSLMAVFSRTVILPSGLRHLRFH